MIYKKDTSHSINHYVFMETFKQLYPDKEPDEIKLTVKVVESTK